jgi:AcrR family transcriptional regulator
MASKQEKILAREEHIIKVAKQLIVEQGFFNLRISDVAKQSQISVGTLYTFPGPEWIDAKLCG